jgi:membrane protein/epoxyqueuosine reductase
VSEPQYSVPPQGYPKTATGATTAAGTMPAFVTPYESKWHRWRNDGKSLLTYLLDSEVHTFAFSVAANAILSFIPFMVLLYKLANGISPSGAMAKVVNDMVNYFIPIQTHDANFFTNALSGIANAPTPHGTQAFSLVMILIACTGIFLPLEVALNQAWGVKKSRNYIMNQIVAFGLAFLMVVLGMGSIFVNTVGRQVLRVIFFDHTNNFVFYGLSNLLLIGTTGVASILFFFSVYWLMPNCKINPRHVLKTAMWTGIIWLGSKYIFEWVLPHMELKSLYGFFYVSVSLLFWAYISGLILFAGAQFSVSRMGTGKKAA